MKRIALLLLAFALLFSACGQAVPEPAPETTLEGLTTEAPAIQMPETQPDPTETTTENETVGYDGIRAFSYEQDIAKWANEWCVATEGFQNVTENIVSGKEDAICLAKNETTIEYN